MHQLHGVTIIGRKHTNRNGQHHCVTPTLYANGKLFHEISATKGLFVNLTFWYWKPANGFYGLFSIRSVEGWCYAVVSSVGVGAVAADDCYSV